MTVKVDRKAGRIAAKELLTCPDGSRPRVLLAEDSSAARILTTALLTRMGCDVDAVEHGEDAVMQAQACSYDVIIMDIEMPVMDGVTAAQQIRALDGPTSRTPIVALSAFLADSRKATIWRESFDINMAKPAGRDQLRQVIQAVIDVSRGMCVETNDSQDPSRDGDGLIDQEALARLRSEMTKDALEELFRLVIAEMQDCARQLSEKRPENEQKAVAKVAHKLKGIASTFAAPKLEQMSAKLEKDADRVSTAELVARVSQTCACADETAAALNAARTV